MGLLLEAYEDTGITTIFLVILIITCFVYWLSGRQGRRFPPGPMGLPVVGYLPYLTTQPHLKLEELRKKYGPVFSLKLGSRYVIVLGDFKSIRTAFAQDAFMGRPHDTPFDIDTDPEVVEIVNGLKWRGQRSFSIQMFRDLGLGKSSMEEHVKNEIACVLEKMEETRGRPSNISLLLAPSMSNNISSLVFGRRMEFNDPKRIMLDGILRDMIRLAEQVGLDTFFPSLTKLLRFLGVNRYDQMRQLTRTLKSFIKDEVQDHEKTLDANNIRDYIDGYLLEIEKRKSDPDTTFKKPVLQELIATFFGAGSETVRSTLDWLLLTVASFQDVQKRIHEEISDAIGEERQPMWADHRHLPYTQAVVMELMRWKTIFPINVLRYTVHDTQLHSFTIPKHCCVMSNLWAVHHDPDLWDDPDAFKPERFLTKDGKKITKPDYFIPFSIGKRSCPGESLANMEVFLYFSSILQKFHLRLPEGAKPDFEGVLGFALQVKPYELCLEPRA